MTSEQQRAFFQEHGYLLIPNLFSRAEIAAVLADEQRLQTQQLVTAAGGRNQGGMVVEDGNTPRFQEEFREMLRRHEMTWVEEYTWG